MQPNCFSNLFHCSWDTWTNRHRRWRRSPAGTAGETFLHTPGAQSYENQLITFFLGISVMDQHWSRSSYLLQCGSGSRSQINADPCGSGPWSDFAVTKNWFLHIHICYSMNSRQFLKHTCVGTKAFLKGWKSRLFVIFCQFHCSWIWISLRNKDQISRPGEQKSRGSRLRKSK